MAVAVETDAEPRRWTVASIDWGRMINPSSMSLERGRHLRVEPSGDRPQVVQRRRDGYNAAGRPSRLF